MADQEENVEQQEETATETPSEGSAGDGAEAEAEPVAAAESEAAASAPAAVAEPEAEPEAAPEAAAAEEAPIEEHTFESLHKKTVAELRDIAQGIEHEALQGYSTMHKEHLVPALCEALGIEAHAHHEVVGIDKDKVKARIRALKAERQQALAAGDRDQLRIARRRIKSLKRKIRRATV